MGTLGKQSAREPYDVSDRQLEIWLEKASALAKLHSISVADVIAAKRVLELQRRNCMDAQAGEHHDEQMGGFGQILSRIADALENLKGG